MTSNRSKRLENIKRKMGTDYTGEYVILNTKFFNPDTGITLYKRERKDPAKLKKKPTNYFMELTEGKYEYLSSLVPDTTAEGEVYHFDNYKEKLKVEIFDNKAIVEKSDDV